MLQKVNNLTVDLTSFNKVFNCLSPQGSWLFHRFGKRSYPESSLDINKLIKFIDANDISHINFFSVFGDPYAHNEFESIINLCKEKDITSNITTSGCYENILNYSKSSHYVKLYGFTKTFNTIIKDYSVDDLKENLLKMKNLTIEYNCYDHNLIDLPELLKFCKNHNIDIVCVPGISVYFSMNHIINEHGEWLYDIYSSQNLNDNFVNKPIKDFEDAIKYFESFESISLNQTMVGYHLLKSAINYRNGKNILDAELFKYNKHNIDDEGTFITYTGHFCKNFRQLVNVTSAMSNDWLEKDFNLDEPYHSEVFQDLSDFANNKISL